MYSDQPSRNDLLQPWDWHLIKSDNGRIRAGFKDFKQDMRRARTAEEGGKVIIEKAHDYNLFSAKDALDRGTLADASTTNMGFEYQTVRRLGSQHATTYLLDSNGHRYAAVQWRGGNDYIKTLSDNVTKLEEASRASGSMMESNNGVQLTIVPSGQPEVKKSGPKGRAKAKDPLLPWLTFFEDDQVKMLKRRCTAFLHRAFPQHARLFTRVNQGKDHDETWTGHDFSSGNISSLFVNALSASIDSTPYRDTSDPASTLCGIFPFGPFDPSENDSGALLLHEAKQKILLGPGDFCLIPSALLTHSHVPLVKGHQYGSLVMLTGYSLETYLSRRKQSIEEVTEEDRLKWEGKAAKYWSYFVKWGGAIDKDEEAPE